MADNTTTAGAPVRAQPRSWFGLISNSENSSTFCALKKPSERRTARSSARSF